MDKRCIYGNTLSDNAPPAHTPKDVVRLDGSFKNKPSSFGLTQEHLSKHSLLVGATGCGKTTLLNTIIAQLQAQMTNDDVMIVFDSKGDFYSRFGQHSNSLVIGNSKPYYNKSVRWNIFKEICADGMEERYISANAQEICKNLFADREQRSNNPFFPNAARDLLASLLVFFIRTGKDDPVFRKAHFYNNAFKAAIDASDCEKLLEFLSFDEDTRSVASYISGNGEQANGVLAEMYSVMRDIFSGVFAEHGMFSIREFVRKKGKKTLFIEYDLSLGQTLTPVYRLLFDLALKEALSRQVGQGNVYLICDEFRLLPHLQHIDDGVNFGRSLGVKIFAGVQNVEQIFEIYKENRGRSILAGFSNLFLFHADDPSTLKYFTERSGRNVVLDSYTGTNMQMQDSKRTASTVEDWDLMDLRVGEAIVSLAFSRPFRFWFKKT